MKRSRGPNGQKTQETFRGAHEWPMGMHQSHVTPVRAAAPASNREHVVGESWRGGHPRALTVGVPSSEVPVELACRLLEN